MNHFMKANKKEICRYNIKSDLYRYTTKVSKYLFIKHLLINSGFKYMYFHRKYNYYKDK